MKIRLACIVFAAAAIVATSGCSSQTPHFYALSATAVPETRLAAPVAVLVGPITIPASVDRPQFVVQAAAHRVEVEEFDRWDSPLNDSIARVVARDLSIQLASPDVAVAPLANFKPSYRVAIDIQRFESTRGQAAIVEAVWTVRSVADGQTKSGHTLAREPVQSNSFSALAAAHSRALAKLSGDIAAAIRAEAAPSS